MSHKTYLYICELKFKNGDIKHPIMISGEDFDWQQQLDDAQAYLSHRYLNDATLEIILAKDVYAAGVAYPELLKPWKRYLDFNYKKINTKTATFLREIRTLDFPSWLLGLLEWDLDVEKNEKRFRDFVSEKVLDGGEKKLLDILTLAKEAHHSQTQMRPKDIEKGNTSLYHIPYINHPIQIANLSFEIGLSLASIEAALLHDVTEDTKINDEQLRVKGVDEDVIDFVKCLSRDKNLETREQFLHRVNKLKGEVLVVKCLDRFHNLIRSFSTKDPEYLDRYINESKIYFSPIFRTELFLADISLLFEQLLVELENYKKIIRP